MTLFKILYFNYKKEPKNGAATTRIMTVMTVRIK
jgi:hypothetical protein